MRDPDRRRKMGQAGRERGVGATVPVAHFSVERMVQQMEALYEELVREKMGLEWGGEKVATYLITACGKRHNLLELEEGLERAVEWYKSRR